MKHEQEWNRKNFSKLAAVTGLGLSVLGMSAPNAAASEPAGTPASQAAYEAQYERLHAQNPELYPTRVSRGIFERDLKGTMTVSREDSAPVDLESRVTWEEYPTTLPAPQGAYLADFRDYQACAVYDELNGAKLCFEVAPDVTTVDLSAKKMQAAISEYTDAPSGCTVALQDVKFVDSKKVENGFEVTYSAQSAPNAGCPTQAGPVTLELSVRAQ